MPLKEFISYISREKGTNHTTQGIHWDGQEAEDRSKEKAQTLAFIGVSQGKATWDRVNSLGLAGLNNYSGLWAVGVVSSCLVPGPG